MVLFIFQELSLKLQQEAEYTGETLLKYCMGHTQVYFYFIDTQYPVHSTQS